MSAAALLALVSGVAAAIAARDLLGGGVVARGAGAARGLAALVDAVVALGREGRDPGAVERRRLLLAGAGVAFALGAFVAGPAAGLALAAGGPWAVARVLRARRERYRRAVDAGVPGMAVAVADALAGGHSLRGALSEAARAAGGAAGHELRRAAAELAAGAPTEEALEAMRARVRSPRVDSVRGRLPAAAPRRRRPRAPAARQRARRWRRSRGSRASCARPPRRRASPALLVVLLPLGGACSPSWRARAGSPAWRARS